MGGGAPGEIDKRDVSPTNCLSDNEGACKVNGDAVLDGELLRANGDGDDICRILSIASRTFSGDTFGDCCTIDDVGDVDDATTGVDNEGESER
jgi:hypothetical protein